MADIKISVITVTYNSAKSLKDTIASVLDQTCPPYEYIIKDGGSTDDTLKVAESFRLGFESRGIIYKIVSEPDKGIYDAMNAGIRLASGDIIGLINSDDWYEANALCEVKRVYEEKGFDLFYADIRMHMENGRTFIKHSRSRAYMTSRDWNHPTTFITKKIYDDHQYRTETIHDDYDLILRLKKEGVHIEVSDKVLANFRMNGVSHKRDIKKAIERIRIKYGIYRRNGYSRLYFFECFIVEAGKFIIG